MKKMLVVLVILVLGFFFVTALRGEEKIATNGGRYQLLQVRYTGYDTKGETYNIDTILKIDTETGKTYCLSAKTKCEVPVEEKFIEIEDCAVSPKEKNEPGQGKGNSG